MSKGSKIVSVRIPKKLLAMVTEELRYRKVKGYTRRGEISEYIRSAIGEKINHARRSRRASKPIVVEPIVFEDFDDLTGEAC